MAAKWLLSLRKRQEANMAKAERGEKSSRRWGQRDNRRWEKHSFAGHNKNFGFAYE